jgi:hypothetical protein
LVSRFLPAQTDPAVGGLPTSPVDCGTGLRPPGSPVDVGVGAPTAPRRDTAAQQLVAPASKPTLNPAGKLTVKTSDSDSPKGSWLDPKSWNKKQ